MHFSKGLEFPIVFISGLGYLPHQDSQLQQEARLLYVEMTRATDRLTLTYHRASDFVTKVVSSVEQVLKIAVVGLNMRKTNHYGSSVPKL
ncbi:ATP-binding domain-containing protein [Trichocoleus sp. Lan]